MSGLMSDSNEQTNVSSKEDIFKALNEDDDESPGKDDNREEKEKKSAKNEVEDTETDEGEDEDEKETIELVDDEQGDDEPKETEEKLAIPVKKGLILKKYPELFKDFPILEKTYYAHQKYAEVFATPEEAQEAAERVGTLDKFEKHLVEDGSLIEVLTAVKETNPESFNKIVDDYFEVLGKVDPQAQLHVAGGVIKGLIVNMIKAARSQGEKGEPLAEAAHIINQYIFGSDQFEPQGKLSKQTPENEEAKKLQKEREEFTNQKYEDARSTLNGKVTNILKSTINANIDPKGGMTDYVKRNAVNDALNIVNEAIRNDKAFMKILDGLWKNAFQKNFDKNALAQIESALKSKARTVLEGAIKKVRNEAFRGLNTSRTERDRRGPLTPGRSSSESNRGNKGKEVDTKGMRTVDALNALMGDD